MSGPAEVPLSQIQPLDYVHWTAPKCPGDNYHRVIAIAPNTDLVIIYRGVRKTVRLSQVTLAIRNPDIPQKTGPNLDEQRQRFHGA